MKIESKIGIFEYNEDQKAFLNHDNYVHWCIDTENLEIAKTLIVKAEKVFLDMTDFKKMTKEQIAKDMIDYKNDVYAEYDENDPDLNWDDVDAGKYDTTIDEFIEKIKLLDIIIFNDEIYCEFKDGELFGGHRIHATLSYDYKLLSASI